jgi:hypothetical protein
VEEDKRNLHIDEHIVLDDELPSHHMHHDNHPVESPKEYAKLAAVFVAIIVVSMIITSIRGWDGNRFANDFMATFFMTFAAFKFFRLEEFAIAFRGYDIIAKRYRPWPYIFPFVEAFLGFGYFVSTNAWQLNIITMLVTGVGAYGVWLELKKKSNIPCACLGTIIKLPLTKVSLAENLTMFVMAALMLVS